MATTVQEYAAEVGVKQLVHFTRESNLESILNRGLVTREMLTRESFNGFTRCRAVLLASLRTLPNLGPSITEMRRRPKRTAQ